jgi:hypothetical protein
MVVVWTCIAKGWVGCFCHCAAAFLASGTPSERTQKRRSRGLGFVLPFIWREVGGELAVAVMFCCCTM